MRKLLFVTALLASACAEQVGPTYGPDEDEDPIPPADVTMPPKPVRQEIRDVTRRSHLNVCDLLPPGDGPCSHACDPVALVGDIPPGTCASFSCTLTDGTMYITGGCSP
jgi:hypothetical protein